jgi:hypothetical protein
MAGNIEIDSRIQNSGSGAINVVAGWNGVTLDPGHFSDAGVYGNNASNVTIGGVGASGNAAVGSAGGTTTILADAVSISGTNGYAQLGFSGTGSGTIVVDALGAIGLSGSNSSNYAQIGNGNVFASNADGGVVDVSANRISATGNTSIVADMLAFVLSSNGSGGGSLGTNPAPIQIASNHLSLVSAGANAFIASPSLGISVGVGINGVTMNGGTLKLTAGGALGQTKAINAAALNVATTSGAIDLENAGNAFGTLTVLTHGVDNATFVDTTALTIANATVGGTLKLTAGGALGQTGAINAAALNVATTSGAISLTSTQNSILGTIAINTPSAASFYNSVTTTVGSITVGGDLLLLSKGDVVAATSVQKASGNVEFVAGWDGITTSPASLSNAGAFGQNNGSVTIGGSGASGDVAIGSATGTTTILAYDVAIAGTNGYAQLGHHGASGGAINLTASHDLSMTSGVGYVMIGNGSLNDDVSGNVTGNINVQVTGLVHDNMTASAPVFFGDATSSGVETGNLTLVLSGDDGNTVDVIGSSVMADIAGGDVSVAVTGSQGLNIDHNYAFTSAHTLSLLAVGNVAIDGSLQNSGAGAINIVAGWDGRTLTPSSFGNSGVFGNSSGSVSIGGASASGNVALGSTGGTTSIFANRLDITAANGYAQLGFNGHGTGAVSVNVKSNVTLTGGSGADQFAQIGNGGFNGSGDNLGSINIAAGGDLILTGGSGSEAYAQVGHGGAESNGNAAGYNNTAPITVTAVNVTLSSGSGSAAYSQVGNGGFKAGEGLTGGTATNGGDITITAGHAVSLLGNGTDAYAQIGNGGGQSNINPASAARGVDSGNIVVHAPNGSAGAVTLTAGAGADAFAQIGDGGYAVNSGPSATATNFTVGGSVSVTDLALVGGNTAANSYAQIGNGDASLKGDGSVSGNIVVDANGNITLTNGTAPNSPAEIGNFIGTGTATGTVAGVTPPGSTIINDPVTQGVIVSQTAAPPSTPITTIETDVVPTGPINLPTAPGAGASPDTQGPISQGPIAQLSNSDGDTPYASDSATVIIADSLDGSTKAAITQQILGGYLSQIIPAAGGLSVHGIRSVDQDFSSWGNEALWQ